MQHAEAMKEEQDPERPLSEKGRRDLDKISNFLERKGIKVTKIVHSGKLRAKQTAEKLSETIDSSSGLIESDGLSPLDEPEIWIGRLEEEKNDIMIVGHLPHLSKIVSLLLLGDTRPEAIRFKNGGVVCLEKNQERKWLVQWIVTPDILN